MRSVEFRVLLIHLCCCYIPLHSISRMIKIDRSEKTQQQKQIELQLLLNPKKRQKAAANILIGIRDPESYNFFAALTRAHLLFINYVIINLKKFFFILIPSKFALFPKGITFFFALVKTSKLIPLI